MRLKYLLFAATSLGMTTGAYAQIPETVLLPASLSGAVPASQIQVRVGSAVVALGAALQAAGGGTAAAGGTNGQVQVNSAGSLAGLTSAQLTALVNPASTSAPGLMPQLTGNASAYLNGAGGFTVPAGSGGGTGTVTSVGISVPSFMTAGAAITTSGTIPLAFSTQGASYALIAPAGGGVPVFRAITTADVAGDLAAANNLSDVANAATAFANLGGPAAIAVETTRATTAEAARVPLAGGTMTGALLLSGNPTVSAQAANKGYVDASQVAGLPSTTAGQLYGTTTTAGVAVQISLGTNLSMTGNVLNATGSGGTTYTGTAPIVVSGSVISATVGTAAGTLAAGNDSRFTTLASTSAPGLAPTRSGNASTYLDGTGNYSTPAGGGGSSNLNPISTTYTATGDINVADTNSVINCTSACTLRLAAATDTHELVIHNISALAVQLQVTPGLGSSGAPSPLLTLAAYVGLQRLEYQSSLGYYLPR